MTTATDSSRVFYLSAPLRASIKAARLEKGCTVPVFYADTIAEQLPGLTESLLGLCRLEPTKQNGPMKVGMSTATLKSLHAASAKTGISQVQLVQCCLLLAVGEKVEPKPVKKTPRKSAAKKPTRKATRKRTAKN